MDASTSPPIPRKTKAFIISSWGNKKGEHNDYYKNKNQVQATVSRVHHAAGATTRVVQGLHFPNGHAMVWASKVLNMTWVIFSWLLLEFRGASESSVGYSSGATHTSL